MIKYLFLFASCLYSTITIAQQDTAKANATMNEATVYFGNGAELTHKAKVPITKNTKYIVIDKLSTQIDLNSLQISCPETVSLLSQQFSIFYPQPTVKPLVINPVSIKIKDSIKKANREIITLRNKINIAEATLLKTSELIEATIQTSGSKTTLTAEVLKLVDFNNAKIEKNKNLIFSHLQEIDQLQEKITALNEQLIVANSVPKQEGEITEKPYGRIIMQVLCRNEQQANVSLSYYTTHAGWQLIYDIRVNSKNNAMKLLYKANVIQNTGIDWNDTKLTLSTGTPNFTTAAPILNAWYLQYYVPMLYNTLNEVVATGYANRSRNSIQSFTDNDFKKEIEGKLAGANVQNVQPSTLDQYTILKQGLLNTSFEIDLPYNIASNGTSHSINIKEQEIQSNLKNYAVPKLDADAYLLAEISNWQNLDLLPGNANIIMDDTYIGKSFIDPNSTADTLNLSLGKDKRISIKRNLIKDAALNKNKDANTKQTFTYELTVKNNKTTEVNMVLKDQHPLSNEKDIVIELTDDGGAAINTDVAVLTWKINLKPGESKKVRFTYTVKYPKDKKINNLK